MAKGSFPSISLKKQWFFGKGVLIKAFLLEKAYYDMQKKRFPTKREMNPDIFENNEKVPTYSRMRQYICRKREKTDDLRAKKADIDTIVVIFPNFFMFSDICVGNAKT